MTAQIFLIFFILILLIFIYIYYFYKTSPIVTVEDETETDDNDEKNNNDEQKEEPPIPPPPPIPDDEDTQEIQPPVPVVEILEDYKKIDVQDNLTTVFEGDKDTFLDFMMKSGFLLPRDQFIILNNFCMPVVNEYYTVYFHAAKQRMTLRYTTDVSFLQRLAVVNYYIYANKLNSTKISVFHFYQDGSIKTRITRSKCIMIGWVLQQTKNKWNGYSGNYWGRTADNQLLVKIPRGKWWNYSQNKNFTDLVNGKNGQFTSPLFTFWTATTRYTV